jgi:hypothetical protein
MKLEFYEVEIKHKGYLLPAVVLVSADGLTGHRESILAMMRSAIVMASAIASFRTARMLAAISRTRLRPVH